MRHVHPKELENVVKLSGAQRYDHFIKTVIGTRVIWTLVNDDGWVLAGDPHGVELVPVWPAPEYAQLCVGREWSDCSPRMISLGDFMEKWVPGMTQDGRKCTVFPTSILEGVNVEPIRLKQDLCDAISRIEYLDE